MRPTKEELFKLYIDERKTLKDICEIYEYKSKSSVGNLLKQYGIQARHGSDTKTKNFDFEFFKTMSPDLAYVLGVFASDGYVKTNGVIGLKSIDKDLIDWIVNTISYKNKINTGVTQAGKTYYEIWFRSVELEKILHGYGITKRKSKTIQFPNIPQDMLRHYVRGLIDGDGFIFERNGSYTAGLCSASVDFIEEFKRIAESVVSGNRKIAVHKDGVLYTYRIHKKDDIKRFGEWLYQGGYYGMKRKKDKFIELGCNVA